jgi:hypothetical protein
VLHDLSLNFQGLLIFPVLSYFNILIINLKKIIPPSYFKLRHSPWKQLTLRTAEGLSWTRWSVIMNMQCDAHAITRHGVAVYFCCLQFCWLMLQIPQSDISGVQHRSLETGPKRLGAWSWQGHYVETNFLYFWHIALYSRDIFARSLLGINFLMSFTVLHSVQYCYAVHILAVECSSSTVAMEMRVGQIFEAMKCCQWH